MADTTCTGPLRALDHACPRGRHDRPWARALGRGKQSLRAVCIGVVIVAAMRAVAADDTFTFPEHPRLTDTFPDAFAPDAPAPGSPAACKRWAGLIRAARKSVDNPVTVPEEGGQWVFYYACPKDNRSLTLKDGHHTCPTCGKVYDDERTRLAYVTIQHNRIDQIMLTLAKAWYVSRQDAFAQEAYRILTRYAELQPTWQRHDRWGRKGMLAVIGGKRHCQSLSDAVGIIKLAKAYDLVYNWPQLPTATRRRIEKDLFEDSARSIHAFYFLQDGRNNHMTWFNAAVATVGAVLGRQDLLDRAINGKKGLRSQFRRSVTAAGLWYEGTIAYHYYALQAVAETVQAAHACGLDLTTEPVLKKLYLAPLHLAYPNGQLPALNDGDYAHLRGYRRMYGFAARTWNDPVLRQFAEKGTVAALPSTVYPDAGLAYLRRGTGANAVTLILDFGRHGGHHGHPDKLNVCLYALGREIFLDPGRLTYRCPEYTTWTRQTVAHNTVTVNMRSQAPRAGRLLAFGRGDDHDRVAGEAACVYADVVLRRALVLFDHAAVDIFTVRGDRDLTMDWTLHGLARPQLPVNVTARGEPLSDANGYQHLTSLKQGALTTTAAVDWRLPDKHVMRTHLIVNAAVELIAGDGIGYQLTQKVPFIMLRRHGREAVFAAVHDFSGTAAATADPVLRRSASGLLTLTFILDGHRRRVTWNAFGNGEALHIQRP